MYRDILTRANAEGADAELMDTGCHYDYRRQAWVAGHDHAHLEGTDHKTADTNPLRFCGADLTTCTP